MSSGNRSSTRATKGVSRHLDKFFRLNCRDVLSCVFPNAKEVTEAFAVYDAAKVVFGDAALHDASILVVCPGDGVSPRTGATAALRSAWTVKSVDPKMGRRWIQGKHTIKRLSCVRAAAEALTYRAPRILVLATHSHASLAAVLAKCEADRVDVVSMPCCVHDDIGEPDKWWADGDCLSPANRVNVYLDVQAVAAAAPWGTPRSEA